MCLEGACAAVYSVLCIQGQDQKRTSGALFYHVKPYSLETVSHCGWNLHFSTGLVASKTRRSSCLHLHPIALALQVCIDMPHAIFPVGDRDPPQVLLHWQQVLFPTGPPTLTLTSTRFLRSLPRSPWLESQGSLNLNRSQIAPYFHEALRRASTFTIDANRFILGLEQPPSKGWPEIPTTTSCV